MSTLGTIENTFVSKVQALTYAAEPAFNTVRGHMIARNDTLPKAILSERMPAAYICFRSMFFDSDTLNLVRYFSVFVAARNLRRQDDTRHDVGGAPGLLTLLELVNDELDGLSMGDTYSLMSGASTASADAKTLVTKLSYSVHDGYAAAAINLDGDAMFAEGSVAGMIAGTPVVKAADFTFPGSKGVIRQVLGTGPREIIIRGILRGADDDSLNDMETGLEALVGDAAVHTLSDFAGRTFSDCVGTSYKRSGNRARQWGNLPVSQKFVMRFEQLAQ